ncbi:MAG: Sapep family Mn(2+)-dependent dipeptidase [Clostridia bacterium]|nr:Sapep family Mn(2+)-dependent dipeptidase [Clostridia bacterium]
MNKTVETIIENNREKLVASLRESIMIPSVEGAAEEGAPFGRAVAEALDHALKTAEGLGLSAENHEGYVGCIEHGEGEEMLGVICHMDVVPEGTGWKHPPYGAEIEDGIIYGRGTLDDKGPAIAAIYALAAIKEAGIKLRRRVRIILGTNEETGWGCMDYYRAHCEAPTLAFTPDGEYPVVNSEKGILHTTFAKKFPSRVRVTAGTRPNVVPGRTEAFLPVCECRVRAAVEKAALDGFTFEILPEEGGTHLNVIGLDAHASMPEHGRNSLQAAFTVMDLVGLEGEDGEMAATLHEAFGMGLHGESMGLDVTDASGRLTLNPGVLDWNEEGVAALKIDVRHPISLSKEDVKAAQQKALGMELVHEHAQHGLYVPADSELVSKLLSVYAERTGKYLPPLAIGGGTYARAFDNAVAFGCEIPGVPAPVHMPNEFISIDDLMFNAHMIADAILALAE